MPDLSFAVLGAEAPATAAVPMLVFALCIENARAEERIATVALRCQIQIAATKRRYSPDEQARLLDLYGEPPRWRDTLRTLLWTHTSIVVPRFTGQTVVDLPVPCTYDFEVASTKYFDALEDGEIPLTFLFSGTVFYQDEAAALQVGQISWAKEAQYRLLVAVWRQMIERHFPNTAYVRMRKDVFDQLNAYKAAHSLPTWEEVFARLLAATSAEVSR